MQEFSIRTKVESFLYRATRKLATAILATSVFISYNTHFIPKSHAAVWVPGYGNEVIPNGFPKLVIKHATFDIWRDIQDFNPHYKFPLWYVAPAIPPFTLARKPWCLPGFKFWGICIPPSPFTKNWCVNRTGCTLTNAFNLFLNIEILHSDEYIERGRQTPDIPVQPTGFSPDYTARDACLKGAKLPYTAFDYKTGQLKNKSAANPNGFEESDLFGEAATGGVVGSKPDPSGCMQAINTPKIETPTEGNAAFSYYMNAGNDSFFKSGDSEPDIYGNSNRYVSSTFFLGDNLGCPNSLFVGTELENPKTPKQWKQKAERCYDYYIFQRAAQPALVLERPGDTTDDPLTKYNPAQSIFNSCQTLLNGRDAWEVSHNNASPIGKGFAPVLQYGNRPDLDEADYNPAEILKRDFVSRFPDQPVPQFTNGIPCLQSAAASGDSHPTNWDTFNDLLRANYIAAAMVEAVYLSKIQGPVLFRSVPSDLSYTSPGTDGGYCPNVEKIVSPGNPFSPRDNIAPEPSTGKLVSSGFKYNLKRDDNATKIYRTDREYSYQTSQFTSKDRMFAMPYGFHYSGWFDPSKLADPAYLAYFALHIANNNGVVPPVTKITEWARYPEVQCAIVPVDILESRREAFNNCIMQRINYNFITFRRENFLQFYFKRRLEGWKKRCATRFWETDTYNDCPMSMSIQQCCRIIVKDVVPLNHLKIRTCEGLRQKRKMIFGYSHIFDARQTRMSEGPDQAAIDAAQAVVDATNARITAGRQSLLSHGCWWWDWSWEGPPGCGHCSAAMNGQLSHTSQGGGDGTCNATVDQFVADLYVTLPENLAALEAAKRLRIPMAVDSTVASSGGKYIKITPGHINDAAEHARAKAELDVAYKENQKLAIIGCDDTEPDQYRFDTYFKPSKWSSFAARIDTSLINKGMNLVGNISNDVLAEIRDQSMTSLFNTLTDTMWGIFDDANEQLDKVIFKAEDLLQVLLTAQRNIENRVEKAEAVYESIIEGDLTDLTVPRVLILLNDPTLKKSTAILEAYIVGRVELMVITPITSTLYEILDIIKERKNGLSRWVENNLKDAVQLVLNKREELFMMGKEKADNLIIEGVQKIQDKVEESLGGLIEDVLNKVYGSDEATMVFSLMGEGGSNMPYMRWWDTGTSAGNPVHGGSFINTLGSYDTIIGVGREERDFFDATQTITGTDVPAPTYTCTTTVRDPNAITAIDAAKQALAAFIANTPEQIYPTYQEEINRLIAELDAAYRISPTSSSVTQTTPCTSTEPDYAACNPAIAALKTFLLNNAASVCISGQAFNFFQGNNHFCNDYPSYFTDIDRLTTKVTEDCNKTITTEAQAVVGPPVTTSEIVPMDLNPQQSLTQTAQMGRVGGWSELKGHQMQTTRRHNLVCLGKYEKLFKYGGQEDFVLAKAGASYTSKTGVVWPWPLGWRGYASERNNQFEKNKEATGLDNAQIGDIIVYKVSGLKRLAYVTRVNQTEPRYVTIQSWDNGKFPTATGASISWGNGVERTIYKNTVPDGKLTYTYMEQDATSGNFSSVTKHIKDIPADLIAKTDTDQPSCEDPYFNACVLYGAGNDLWDDVIIYRPSNDTERRRCPMADYSSQNVNVRTSTLSTDSFAWCVNAGFDPPASYVINDYQGPGTGAIRDTTLCGPNWTECSTTAQPQDVKCFDSAGNESICKVNSLDNTPLPQSTACTDLEMQAARTAYNAANHSAQKSAEDMGKNLETAQANVDKASADYNNFVAANSSRLAELNAKISEQSKTAKPAEQAALTTAKATLDAAIAELNTKNQAVVTANNNYNNYVEANKATAAAAEALTENKDYEDLTSDELAKVEEAKVISQNTQAFAQTLTEAKNQADLAREAVTAAQQAYDALPRTGAAGTPDATLVAERNTIQSQLDTLKAKLDEANAALATAEAAMDGRFESITDPTTGTTTVRDNAPPVAAFKCPYP